MTSAPGTKKKTAASTHRLIDEVPLCPAAAIQRGPSTVAMLNSSTSQKPIVLRNCDLESGLGGAVMVMKPPELETRPVQPWKDIESIKDGGGCRQKKNEGDCFSRQLRENRWNDLARANGSVRAASSDTLAGCLAADRRATRTSPVLTVRTGGRR